MVEMQLRMLKASDFQELVDAAITMEDEFKQVQEERWKKARLEPKGTPENKVTPNLQFKPRFRTGGDEHPRENSSGRASVICHHVVPREIFLGIVNNPRWSALGATKRGI
jgi:hypothetical protein